MLRRLVLVFSVIDYRVTWVFNFTRNESITTVRKNLIVSLAYSKNYILYFWGRWVDWKCIRQSSALLRLFVLSAFDLLEVSVIRCVQLDSDFNSVSA